MINQDSLNYRVKLTDVTNRVWLLKKITEDDATAVVT